MIPVIEEVARKKKWGRMPLRELVDALMQKTQGRVLRSDQDAPADLNQSVVANELYFEVVL